MRSIARSTFCLVAVIALTACVGSRSKAPDLQLLTARPAAATAPLAATIGVGPVRIAQFLHRPQIVTHGGGVVLRVNDAQRWGEPLEQGIQRVLMQNIGVLTGAETRNFPWRQNLTPDYAVRLEVVDLDRLDDGTALLDVSWVLEDLKNARVLKTQQEKLQTRVGAGDSALAEAYSDLLAQLAQRISSQLGTP